MPLYEYECEACAHRFEVIQKFSDPPIDTCPACQGRVRKLLSSPAIQFKGSGWYVTDYAKKDSAKDAAKPSKADTSKDSGTGKSGGSDSSSSNRGEGSTSSSAKD
jgi:putative FmdB family regulatory protein